MKPITDTTRALGRGTRVEVRNHFISSWSDGFEVARVTDDGYRLRRVSDRVELPATFAPDDVRPRGLRHS